MNRILNFSEFYMGGNLQGILEDSQEDIKKKYDSDYRFISDIYVTILINSILSLIQKLTDESRSSLDRDGVAKLEESVQELINSYEKCITSPLNSKFSNLKNEFLASKLPGAVPQRNPKIKYLSGSVISEYKKILDYFPRIVDVYDQAQQDIIQFGLSEDINTHLDELTKANESLVAGLPLLEKKSYQKEKYYSSIEDLSKRYLSLIASLEREMDDRSNRGDARNKVLASELGEIKASLSKYEQDLDLSQIGAHWDLSGKKIREKISEISDFLDAAVNEMTDVLLGELNLTSVLQSLIVKIESSFGRIDSLLEQISRETEDVTAAEVSIPSLDIAKDFPDMSAKFTSQSMPDGSIFNWNPEDKSWTWTNNKEYTGATSPEFREQVIEFRQPLSDVKKQSFTYDFKNGKWHKGSIKGGEITRENELAFLNKAMEVLIKRVVARWNGDTSDAAASSYAKSMKNDDHVRDLSFDNLLKKNPDISNIKK